MILICTLKLNVKICFDCPASLADLSVDIVDCYVCMVDRPCCANETR